MPISFQVESYGEHTSFKVKSVEIEDGSLTLDFRLQENLIAITTV